MYFFAKKGVKLKYNFKNAPFYVMMLVKGNEEYEIYKKKFRR